MALEGAFNGLAFRMAVARNKKDGSRERTMKAELEQLYEHIDDIEIAMMTTRRPDGHLPMSTTHPAQGRASQRASLPVSAARVLLVMPHVAARTTSTILPESGLQCGGGLGALTPRTGGTRIWRGGMTILPLAHSGVPERLFGIPTAPVGTTRSASIDRI